MAQLGHKNRLCDAWSCASFGNKDKHNQTAGTRLRKFHRSCNTDEYIFSFRSNMLNLCFMLQYNRWRNWQLTVLFRQCSQPDAFQYFQVHEAYYCCIWYCTVYGSVNGWQNQQTAGEKEGKHGAESTPQISSNFSHIICTFMWNPA